MALSPAIAPEVLDAARRQAAREDKAKEDIAAGRGTIHDRWIRKSIRLGAPNSATQQPAAPFLRPDT